MSEENDGKPGQRQGKSYRRERDRRYKGDQKVTETVSQETVVVSDSGDVVPCESASQAKIQDIEDHDAIRDDELSTSKSSSQAAGLGKRETSVDVKSVDNKISRFGRSIDDRKNLKNYERDSQDDEKRGQPRKSNDKEDGDSDERSQFKCETRSQQSDSRSSSSSSQTQLKDYKDSESRRRKDGKESGRRSNDRSDHSGPEINVRSPDKGRTDRFTSDMSSKSPGKGRAGRTTPDSKSPGKGRFSKESRDERRTSRERDGLKKDERWSAKDFNELARGSKSGKKERGSEKKLPKEAMSAADLEAQWQAEEEEKRRAEEEKKRQEEEEKQRREEEQKRQEEEEKRRQEEEKRRQEEEERRAKEEEEKGIRDAVREAEERIEFKTQLRLSNLAAAQNRPDDRFFSKLDSSLKKNTAFVKKLKTLTESQKDSVIKDFESLNLTKYIGEAAASLAEVKLKMSDVVMAVQIASLLHQRYAEFSSLFLEQWQKILAVKKDEKITNASKLRVDIRFFAELIACGIFTNSEGIPVLGAMVSYLIQSDKEEHNNAAIILSFCKHCGEDYAGLVSRKLRLLAEKYELTIPCSTIYPADKQKSIRNLLKDYFSSLCNHLREEHKHLQGLDRQNRKVLQTKGELSAERKEKYEQAKIAYDKLYNNTAAFSDILDEDMPDLPVDKSALFKEDDVGTFDIYNPFRNAECQYEGDTALWEDDDTRSFYENIPDLKALVPAILFKDSASSEKAQQNTSAGSDSTLDANAVEVSDEALLEEEMANLEIEEARNEEGKMEEEEIEEPVSFSDEPEDEGENVNLTMKHMMEDFLNNLPNCVNRDLIDKAALEFCMNLNTKVNRRKLARALFLVPRSRLDLLPFYARLVAALNPCLPDLAEELGHMLKVDFKFQVRKKDQMKIEGKVKVVRFIGELTKFRIYPKAETLYCLKLLLFDFSHHNIDMACNLLESCGRFLFRSPDSHHRTKIYLEQMIRKKTVQHLDSRQSTMVENAFYYCNPPTVEKKQEKVRPPMHQYIRKLIYNELSKSNTEKILRQLRKLNWDDNLIASYIIKCLASIWNVKYNNIHCVANVLAGLVAYQEHVGPQVVDAILEDIRLGMEVNHPRYNQRRVTAVKFLGELYNYRMLESSVIFKTLYSFVTFGVVYNYEVASDLDPPEHLFRIRLICTLLDTCGQYFNRGSSKKKLDCFLVYFQKYILFKKCHPVWKPEFPWPMDVKYMLTECIEALRPQFKLVDTYEEALKAVEELETEYRIKLKATLPPEKQELIFQPLPREEGLDAIQEVDESTVEESAEELSQVPYSEEGEEESDTDDREDRTGDRTRSESQSQPTEVQDEGMGDSEDVLDSLGEEEEDDNVLVLSGGPKRIECVEDEDFMAEFDKVIVENIQQRNQESLKVPQIDIAVPMHIKAQHKLNKVNVYELDASKEEDEEEGKSTVSFILMTKKGNKPQFKNLEVPVTSELVTNLKDRETAEMKEKEQMKRLTLDTYERQEEEEAQELLASLQRPATVNTNRERRTKYQHPKGAPDADLIFGSGQRR